jgi:hypothetical protein
MKAELPLPVVEQQLPDNEAEPISTPTGEVGKTLEVAADDITDLFGKQACV